MQRSEGYRREGKKECSGVEDTEEKGKTWSRERIRKQGHANTVSKHFGRAFKVG